MTRLLFFADFLVKGTGFIAKAFAIFADGVFGAKNFGLVEKIPGEAKVLPVTADSKAVLKPNLP